MPPDEPAPVLPDQGTPRLIMVEGKAWVSHEFHQRFIAELREERPEPRCQHCSCLADERSFMCSDCASEADWDVQTLRDEIERLEKAADAAMTAIQNCDFMGAHKLLFVAREVVKRENAALASDEQDAP